MPASSKKAKKKQAVSKAAASCSAKKPDPKIKCPPKKKKNCLSYAPKNEEEMAETLTGIFEGGGYCTIADSPGDTKGGLSYGKHQAAERQGSLYTLLKQYVDRTEPPLPDSDLKKQMEEQLKNYNKAKNSYTGNRAEHKALLQKACKDKAMEKTQDEFFKERYYDPAMNHAAKYGVTTPLGKAIFYDISIQAGSSSTRFYDRALKRWNKENPNQKAKACQPKDSHGPDEKTFLRYVNAERRKEMQSPTSSPDYQKTTYRPNEHDKLLDQDNMDLKKDFDFRCHHIKGLSDNSPKGMDGPPEPSREVYGPPERPPVSPKVNLILP